MLKHILVPPPITLMNFSIGKPLSRSSGVPHEGVLSACANCGRIDHIIIEDDLPYSMARWLEVYVFADERMNGEESTAEGKKKVTPHGSKMVETVAMVRRVFLSAEPGDEVAVAKPFWDAILSVLDKPGTLFNMLHKSQFYAFEEAWKTATDAPRVVKAANGAAELPASATA